MTSTPFALALRQAREAAGLTQNGLARRTGLYSNHICRMENGQRGASANTVARLARGLRLSVLDTDRLLVAAGYAPRDLVGMVTDVCFQLATDEDRGVAQAAEGVMHWLPRLDGLLSDSDRSLNDVMLEGQAG